MARKARRNPNSWGTIEQLPSGRFRAFYRNSGRKFTAPHTFPTKDAATAWLATERADRARGTWIDPRAGAVTLADFANDWLRSRVDLAPRTQDLYRRMLDMWVLPPIGIDRPVELGSMTLAELSPAVVRTWYAAMLNSVRQGLADSAARHNLPRNRHRRRLHPARAWAMQQGIPVPAAGRVPRDVLEQWQAAGRPIVGLPAGPALPSGRVPGSETEARRWAKVQRLPCPATGRVPASIMAAWQAAGRPVVDDTQPAAPLPPEAGKTTAAHAYSLLRTILNVAQLEGHILQNPCRLPGAGSVKAAERGTASPAEVSQLAAHMPPRLRAAVYLAAWSGLRFGELFALARRHVDVDAGTIRVERALVRLPDQPVAFGPPKTARSRRTVVLPQFVVEIVRKHLLQYVPAAPDALLFTNAHGGPIRNATLHAQFKRARLAVGRPDLRWHDLRHTGATLAYTVGASFRDVQNRLGHATPRAALIYAHIADGADRAIAERLDAVYAEQPANVYPLHAAR